MNELKTIRSPLSVNLELTPACNLMCEFCFVESCSNLEHPPLNRLFRIIDELRKAEVFQIKLFGGEPFFYPHWKEVVDYAYQKGMFLSFASNGTLLDREAACFLKARGVRYGSISIHGTKGVHDSITKIPSYDEAVEGLRMCLEEGLGMTALLTLTQAHKGICVETVQTLLNLGLRDFFFVANRLLPYGRSKKDWDARKLSFKDYLVVLNDLERIRGLGVIATLADPLPYCRVPEKYHYLLGGCTNGTGFGNIDSKGNVNGCPAVEGSFGNLLETSLEEIWQGEEMGKFRSLCWLPDKCRRCDDFCGIGCSASRYGGGRYSPDEFL